MIQVMMEVLKRVTVFMVIGKVIINLGMGKGYEKYIKMVIGFMVVVQLWAGINSTVYTLRAERKESYQEPFFTRWQEEMLEFEKELRGQQREIENRFKSYESTLPKEEKKEEEGYIKIEEIIIGETE